MTEPESTDLTGVDAEMYDIIRHREPVKADAVFNELYSYSRDEFSVALTGLKRDGLVSEVEESLPFAEDATRTVLVTEGDDAGE